MCIRDRGNGGLEISGVAMENGAIKVNKINGAEVNYYGEGGLEISGVGLDVYKRQDYRRGAYSA